MIQEVKQANSPVNAMLEKQPCATKHKSKNTVKNAFKIRGKVFK